MSWRYSLLPVVICRCLGPPASTRSSKMVACPRHDAVCCDGYVLPCHELSTSTSSELQRAPLLIFHANGFCGLAYAPMVSEMVCTLREINAK